MNYWLTTHWPPSVEEDPSDIALGVWISERCKEVSNDFKSGDKVIIYQSKWGRPEILQRADGSTRKLAYHQGKEGIVAICEAVTDIYMLKDSKPSKYDDGSEVWWRWHAKLKLLSRSGFVPRSEINKLFGYSKNYNLRGFGNKKSGIKKLDHYEFDHLTRAFHGEIETTSSALTGSAETGAGRGGGGESEDHKNLKLYVAENPELVLSENGVLTFEVEYSFPTMDRADILLTDQYGRIIGVEIEVIVEDDQYEGLLQAIKYRYMGEVMTGRKPGDSRAALIAYSISDKMKQICTEYNILSIEVDKSLVEKWAKA